MLGHFEGTPRRRCVVAVPARDEVGCIAACLEALDGQAGAQLDDIVLVANNCTDGTADAARAVPLRPGTELRIVEADLPPHAANAGTARRLACDHAALVAGPGGVILTTDADGLVDPDWLAATLREMAAGAEVVAGWAELHPLDWGAIPTRLHEDDARECAYDALCDRIHAALDPDPFDPLPRHTQHSGASIAVMVEAYGRWGGVPHVASGEDRALVGALRRADARIRHSPAVRVVVSGRTVGRAEGGMADTIRRRLGRPDEFLDDRLEPAAVCWRRAAARGALRRMLGGGCGRPDAVAELLGLPCDAVKAAIAAGGFGEAWFALERASPPLRRQLVPVNALPEQMAAAEAMLLRLDEEADARASA